MRGIELQKLQNGGVGALMIALLAGCSLLQTKDETTNWTADQFFQAAKAESREGNYTRAQKLFESLEARYPYGPLAQASMLEVAYVYFRNGDQANAISNCDRFIRQYPNHPRLDYAYYLKGLANFSAYGGFLGFLSEQDLAERDPQKLKDGYDTFKELTELFPNSPYTEDSRARMRYLVNALSRGEVQAARYYFNRHAYVAAIARAQESLKRYPQTPENQTALEIIVQSYERMGETTLAADAKRVLAASFPQSPLINTQTATEKSWWQFW